MTDSSSTLGRPRTRSRAYGTPTLRSRVLARLANLLMLLLLATVIAGCKTTDSAGATDAVRVACQSFQAIYWSKNDTPETVKQVKEHNAAGKAICGWGG